MAFKMMGMSFGNNEGKTKKKKKPSKPNNEKDKKKDKKARGWSETIDPNDIPLNKDGEREF